MTTPAIDLGQFRAVFFEEAAEQLEQMETLLVRLDPASASDEDLNAIFRAAHSIKGGAGTFGFAEMAEVTHVLESLLDRARKRTLVLSGDHVDCLLVARDLLVDLIACYRDGAAVDGERIAAVMASVAALTAGEAPLPARKAEHDDGAVRHLVEIRLFDNAGGAIPVADVERALAGFGEVTRLGDEPPREGSVDGRRGPRGSTVRFWVASASDDVDILGDLAFVVPLENMRIVQKVRVAQQPDGQVVASVPGEPEGYGFFEGGPGAPQDDPGYGFFDEAPGTPAQPSTPLRETPPAVATAAATSAATGTPTAAQPAADTSIRVGIEKVDQLINLVGELVITQAMLAQTASGVDPVAHERLHEGIAQLARNTRTLQEAVMSVRMMPMAVVFNRFPRVVRDLAQKLGKEVDLRTEGEATELDKGLIEKIVDPLTHLVRNSLDHGVETPQARLAAGKPVRGTITLRAFHRGGNIVIEVADDGAGLNRERILAKARERGLPVDEAMPDADVWPLIFEAGLSTAETVTDVSGRGVGMDVVKRNIAALGGRVEIDSHAGSGTRMSIRLPLTLAILDGMSVRGGQETFILPLASVVESVEASAASVRTVRGSGRVIEVRGAFLPIVGLAEALGMPAAGVPDAVFVIVESDGTQVALAVDELLGQHQVVIKSLETNFRRVAGVSGATIMGDGRVALILDVPALVRATSRGGLRQAA